MKKDKKSAKRTGQVATAALLAKDCVITEVKIRVWDQRKNLTKQELRQMKILLLRKIASALTELPYTDYGIDNTKLKSW